MAAQLGSGGGSSSAQLLARVVLGAFLSMGVMVVSLALYGGEVLGADAHGSRTEAALALEGLYRLAALALAAPVVLLIGVPLARAVWTSRRWLSVDVWILLGAAAALILSSWNTLVRSGPVYFETATMILVLVGLGRWIDVRTKERARDRLIRVLPESLPSASRVLDGVEVTVSAAEVGVGDRVRVRPGETLPVDGLVVEGSSFLDTADLTGESSPTSVGAGERALAGSRVLDGTLLIETTAAVGGRVCDDVERLLEESMTSGGEFEQRAERLAGLMIPVVLAAALGIFVNRLWVGAPEQAVGRALAVLLVACPCALGIATPLAFWSALARAWERHVLVKGAQVLERLARVRKVYFDKTGTLTEGQLELAGIHLLTEGLEVREVLRLAAAAEVGSEHPIGLALRHAWVERDAGGLPSAGSFKAIPGVGVEASVEGQGIVLRRSGPTHESERTTILLEVDGIERAVFELEDRMRPEAPEIVGRLREQGLEAGVLSGDARGPVEALGAQLGLDTEWSLLPHQKVARIRELGSEDALFVGDGVNDSAVLAEAGVGLAMHGGSPRSMDAADAVLLASGLGPIPQLIDLGRIAVRTARFNLAWCLVYNLVGVGLALGGALTPMLAATAMVLSGVGVVANTAWAFSAFDRKCAESSEAIYALRRGGELERRDYSLSVSS